MYIVYLDNAVFSTIENQDTLIIDPRVILEKNGVGEFTFTLPHNHPRIDDVKVRKSIFRVYDTREIDTNRDILTQNPKIEAVAMEIKESIFRDKYVRCEGTLTFLNDTVLRPNRYSGISAKQLLINYISEHNQHCGSGKSFEVGVISAVSNADTVACFSNYNTTLTEIIEDLVEDFGGCLKVRLENNVRYIDYLQDNNNVINQSIELGKNLLEFSSNLTSIDICTCLIPLGAIKEDSTTQGLDERVSLKELSYMNGKDYLESASAVEDFGRIYKTVVFDNVTEAQNLYNKGVKYLQSTQFANLVIECRAIDLSGIDSNYENFKLNDVLNIILPSHGLNTTMPITRLELPLWEPENEIVTLGNIQTMSISKQNADISQGLIDNLNKMEIVDTDKILSDAQEEANTLINSAMGGTVVKTQSDLAIYNASEEKYATKRWIWNANGFAHQSRNTINESWSNPSVAITMLGEIVANAITSGTMSANRIRGGTFELGGSNNANGSLYVKNSEGKTLVTLDVNGITLAEGTSISWEHISNKPNIPTDTSISDAITNTVTKSYIDDLNVIAENISGSNLIGKHIANSNTQPTFEVTQDGTLTTKKGYIGGLVIEDDGIYRKDGTLYRGGLSSTYDPYYATDFFTVGNSYNTPVRIESDGHAEFTDIELSGENSRFSLIGESPIQIRKTNSYYSAIAEYGGVRALLIDDTLKSDLSAGLLYLYNGDKNTSVSWSGIISDSLYINGKDKNRIVDTEHFGKLKMHAFETPSPMFADVGEGCTDDTGTCVIFFDLEFTEVVDLSCSYQVFLQANGKGDLYVDTREKDYFIVKGDKNLSFSWEVKAIQKDNDTRRFEAFEGLKAKDENEEIVNDVLDYASGLVATEEKDLIDINDLTEGSYE